MGLRPYRRGWIKGDCPDCGREGKFGVNLSRDRTNCFVCGYNPSPFDLVKELENLKTFEEVKSLLSEYRESEFENFEYQELPDISVKLPEGYNNIIVGDSMIAKKARRTVRKRGFDIEVVASKGWGYCDSGKYFGYLILPYYSKGRLVYFNARRLIGGGAKYVNPTVEEAGIGKALIIYNVDALYLYNEVYLVEGLINAETLGYQGISTAGKKISDEQLSIIKRSPVSKVSIILDPDALVEAIDVALDLSFHKQVRLVYWTGNKDVNDLGREKSMEIINSFEFSNYNDILKLKNRIKYEGSFTTY